MQPPISFTKEPCRTWSDADVYEALTRNPLAYHDHVILSLGAIVNGNSIHETPHKYVIGNEEGDFRSMPSVVYHIKPNRLSKTIKIVGTNNARTVVKDKITVGKAFNIHPVDNFITDVFDANVLSSARTGVMNAIAAEILGADLDKVSVIGCGNVGFFTAFYLCSTLPVEEVSFVDLDANKAELFLLWFKTSFPWLTFTTSNSYQDADTIFCATDSRTPIVNVDAVRATTVISCGADTYYQRELGLDVFGDACDYDVFVDSYDALHYGDCVANKLTSLDVQLISDVILKHYSKKPRNVFITTGNALLDNLTIEYILKTNESHR